MKLHGNVAGFLCTLLALAPVGFSLPRAQLMDVTAEDFMRMKQFKVRADGTSLNNTAIGTELAICGPCTASIGYTLMGDGEPHQNFVITQKGNSVISCPSPGSSTSTGLSTTLGWSLSLGVNAEFESFGFSVTESETYSTSNSFNCNGVADARRYLCSPLPGCHGVYCEGGKNAGMRL